MSFSVRMRAHMHKQPIRKACTIQIHHTLCASGSVDSTRVTWSRRILCAAHSAARPETWDPRVTWRYSLYMWHIIVLVYEWLVYTSLIMAFVCPQHRLLPTVLHICHLFRERILCNRLCQCYLRSCVAGSKSAQLCRLSWHMIFVPNNTNQGSRKCFASYKFL